MVNSSFKKSKNKQKKYNKMNKEQNNKEKNKSTNNIELNNKVLLEIEQIKEKENLIKRLAFHFRRAVVIAGSGNNNDV